MNLGSELDNKERIRHRLLDIFRRKMKNEKDMRNEKIIEFLLKNKFKSTAIFVINSRNDVDFNMIANKADCNMELLLKHNNIEDILNCTIPSEVMLITVNIKYKKTYVGVNRVAELKGVPILNV